jgi:hypothetical protein
MRILHYLPLIPDAPAWCMVTGSLYPGMEDIIFLLLLGVGSAGIITVSSGASTTMHSHTAATGKQA